MTTAEVLILVMTVALVVLAVAVAVLVRRLLPLVAEARTFARSATRTTRSLGRVADDLEQVSGDVRSIGHDLAGPLGDLVERVVPPIRNAGAWVTGLRQGLSALFRSRRTHRSRGGRARSSGLISEERRSS